MASRFNASYSGIGQMLRMAGIRGDMVARAGRVRDVFEATAPLGPPIDGDGEPAGTFKSSARVDSYVRKDFKGEGSRAAAAVVLTDPLGLVKERGHLAENGEFVQGAHTLTRALDAAAG